MKFDALFEAGFKELGTRFFLVAFLPTLLVAVLIVGLDSTGAPEQAPSWNTLVKTLNGIDLSRWVGLVLVVLVASLLTMPLQVTLVRFLEGYWERFQYTESITQWARNRHARKREVLDDARMLPSPATLMDEAKSMSAARRLMKYYPRENRLLPTALGNAMRAAEDLAYMRYGLDSVVIWPTLYPLVNDRLATLVDSARNQLDISVRLCPTFSVCAVISFGYLHAHGWWLLMPLGFLILAWLSYQGAVEAAAAYGVTINAAIDLH